MVKVLQFLQNAHFPICLNVVLLVHFLIFTSSCRSVTPIYWLFRPSMHINLLTTQIPYRQFIESFKEKYFSSTMY